jgi:hypothetical protein
MKLSPKSRISWASATAGPTRLTLAEFKVTRNGVETIH